MEHLQTERDSLAQEVRRLRKHANALKISGRLRRIHADGAGAHDHDSHAGCPDGEGCPGGPGSSEVEL